MATKFWWYSGQKGNLGPPMYVVLWKLVNPLLKFEDPRVTLGWIRSRSERRSQQLSRKPVLVHRWKLVDLNRLKWIVAQRVKWVGQHNWPLILRGRREELYIRAWSNGKLGGGGGGGMGTWFPLLSNHYRQSFMSFSFMYMWDSWSLIDFPSAIASERNSTSRSKDR